MWEENICYLCAAGVIAGFIIAVVAPFGVFVEYFREYSAAACADDNTLSVIFDDFIIGFALFAERVLFLFGNAHIFRHAIIDLFQ